MAENAIPIQSWMGDTLTVPTFMVPAIVEQTNSDIESELGAGVGCAELLARYVDTLYFMSTEPSKAIDPKDADTLERYRRRIEIDLKRPFTTQDALLMLDTLVLYGAIERWDVFDSESDYDPVNDIEYSAPINSIYVLSPGTFTPAA